MSNKKKLLIRIIFDHTDFRQLIFLIDIIFAWGSKWIPIVSGIRISWAVFRTPKPRGKICFCFRFLVCLFFQYSAKGARNVITGQLCWRLFHILNYRKLDILSQASLEINFKIFVWHVFVNSLKSNECFIKEIWFKIRILNMLLVFCIVIFTCALI